MYQKWDLSSLTRDQTHVPFIGRGVLTTGPPEKSPRAFLFEKIKSHIFGCWLCLRLLEDSYSFSICPGVQDWRDGRKPLATGLAGKLAVISGCYLTSGKNVEWEDCVSTRLLPSSTDRCSKGSVPWGMPLTSGSSTPLPWRASADTSTGPRTAVRSFS